jgi:hypothetical protein
VLRFPFGREEELVVPDEWLGAPALVGKGAAGNGTAFVPSLIARSALCPLPGLLCPLPSALCPGFAVRGLDPFSLPVASRHTAPIGNLGMRTQATRHVDCTANLHRMMRTAFLDRNRDS